VIRAIVTRPAPEAEAWVKALEKDGVEALALPLIEIRPTRDPAALAAAWAGIDGFEAVMFVSAPAVAHFFAAQPALLEPGGGPAVPWRAWATGPGTAAALERAGVPKDAIDLPDTASAQWDSEALWQRVRGHFEDPAPAAQAARRRVLIVRGADAQGRAAGRDWLAQQLQACGVDVEFAQSYERHPPLWTAASRAFALASVPAVAPDAQPPGVRPDTPAVWVFSSSEAIANLLSLMPGQSWARACAVATHPRIAQSARDAGFGVVCLSRPGLDAVRASIKSLR
jgi:uroporphyrinogen-III synthase